MAQVCASIGSARTLESIVKILSFISLFIFLLKLFHKNYLYAYLTFLILITFCIFWIPYFPIALTILPRDVITFLFIILFLLVLLANPQPCLSQENNYGHIRTGDIKAENIETKRTIFENSMYGGLYIRDIEASNLVKVPCNTIAIMNKTAAIIR